ncbi:DUF4236 domain-containing protein [Variovorax sp. LjRoot290]|uniref:DUF4236 domain-containing protein n=1 Tax=Variovorax sp. LjRoot290 TaxID=3342316 RepID=UPI003ED12086
MALRFRKSIKLAPGVRWNLSGSGSSWTFGPRGASVNVGSRGTFLNAGIPGSGLSSRTRLSAERPAHHQAAPAAPQVASAVTSLTCSVQDDGQLVFTNAAGQQATEAHIALAKTQAKDVLRGLIADACEKVNGQIEALARLHLETPDPREKPRFHAPPFPEPQPAMAATRLPKWWERWVPGRLAQIADGNHHARELHDEEMNGWTAAKLAYDRECARRRVLVEIDIYRDPSAMEAFLEARLQEVVWPRETQVALEVKALGELVMLDVDLPEIEEMPTQLAAVPARGLRLSVKELSRTKVQKMYMSHVHGIAFRLIGEAFAALPLAGEVVLSAFTQRRNAATAQLGDEYLISVRVQRSEWNAIDFQQLQALDVVEALARFELRRDMSKTGVFKAIAPLDGSRALPDFTTER